MKIGTAPIRFTTTLKLVFVAALAVTFFMVLIIQNTNIKRLSEELADRERRISEIKKEIQICKSNLASLKTPDFLLRQLREMGINLQEIAPSQIVRVYEQDRSFRSEQVAVTGDRP